MYGYEFCITIPDNFKDSDCYTFPNKVLPGGIFGSIKFKLRDTGKTWGNDKLDETTTTSRNRHYSLYTHLKIFEVSEILSG